jgi:cytochrome c peroxidase
MGDAWPAVVEKIAADADYAAQFAESYGGDISKETITRAIAEFERSLATPHAPFDKYLNGDKAAISDEAKRGFLLFNETGCTACHTGSYFGGESFQKLADSYFAARGGDMTDADNGRFNVTGDEADRHVFKVPMLRNVAVTFPYFHDGSAADLEEAVRNMARHQLGTELDDADAAAIAAFLRSLTGEYEGVPLDRMAAE